MNGKKNQLENLKEENLVLIHENEPYSINENNIQKSFKIFPHYLSEIFEEIYETYCHLKITDPNGVIDRLKCTGFNDSSDLERNLDDILYLSNYINQYFRHLIISKLPKKSDISVQQTLNTINANVSSAKNIVTEIQDNLFTWEPFESLDYESDIDTFNNGTEIPKQLMMKKHDKSNDRSWKFFSMLNKSQQLTQVIDQLKQLGNDIDGVQKHLELFDLDNFDNITKESEVQCSLLNIEDFNKQKNELYALKDEIDKKNEELIELREKYNSKKNELTINNNKIIKLESNIKILNKNKDYCNKKINELLKNVEKYKMKHISYKREKDEKDSCIYELTQALQNTIYQGYLAQCLVEEMIEICTSQSFKFDSKQCIDVEAIREILANFRSFIYGASNNNSSNNPSSRSSNQENISPSFSQSSETEYCPGTVAHSSSNIQNDQQDRDYVKCLLNEILKYKKTLKIMDDYLVFCKDKVLSLYAYIEKCLKYLPPALRKEYSENNQKKL